MAELIVSDKERAAASYLDWDDASVGRVVKRAALIIGEKSELGDGGSLVSMNAAAMYLTAIMRDANADETTLTVKGLTCRGKSLGDYQIVVRRTDNPAECGKERTGE